MKKKLAENWRRVEQRVGEACSRFGRDPASVTIVAVTKYATLDVIRALAELRVPHLGESHVQELTRRAAMVKEWLLRRALDSENAPLPAPSWHMVGHLQRNKVKQLLPFVDLIHSVDSLRLAEEIDARSAALERVTPILLEVNAADEPQKSGVAVAAATHLTEQLRTLKHVELRGLMAMAPLTEDSARTRRVFGRMRELFDEIITEKIGGPAFQHLSLGMSSDFEWGIEAGATYVRIGSAIFEGIELAPQPVHAEQ